MQAIINNSPSKLNDNLATSQQHFHGSASAQNNDRKIIPLMLVAQELLFFQSLKILLGFYKANPSWQFNIAFLR